MRFVLLIGFLLCFSAVAARADAPLASAKKNLCLQDEVCRDHYAKARDLSNSGKLIEAIKEYEAAYVAVQTPFLLYNIGRLHHRLGNLGPAAANYHRYLSGGIDEDPEQLARAKEYLRQTETAPPPTSPPAPAIDPKPVGVPIVPSKSKPIYKKWWFWTALGGVALAAVAVGVGVGITTSKSSGLPSQSEQPQIPDGVQLVMFNF